jgi:hypothetical protein
VYAPALARVEELEVELYREEEYEEAPAYEDRRSPESVLFDEAGVSPASLMICNAGMHNQTRFRLAEMTTTLVRFFFPPTHGPLTTITRSHLRPASYRVYVNTINEVRH